MGNSVPRHSYKVDPDYSSAGSNESLPSPRCYRYNMTQGKSQGQHVTPTLMKEMSCDNLQHLCCSSDGTVWVCRRPQIIQLDGKGQTLLLLEVKIEICGLAASKHGELVFTDGKNKRLVSTRFEDDVITKKVMSTNDWYPIGVCFAENGDIVVGLFLPSTRGSVTRYTQDGDTRYTLENDNNGCPMFCFPAFVTENGNGDVVVSDHLKRAVIAVDRWGRYRFSYIADKLNRPDAVPFLPFGVCCDSSLNIIISDSCNDCLHLVSVNGEFLYMLLTKASGLFRPVALSMSKNGNLYMGDRNGIKIFHMDTQKGASDGRKSSRTNSLSSLEINRTSGKIERTPPLERLWDGSQSVGPTKLKRSSTENNMSGNVTMNSTEYSKSYYKGGGGIKTNPMASSFSFPNKSATLPLKASLTNVTSGFCSPLTSRRTNTLMNASRAAPLSSSSSSSTSLASSTSSLSPASPKKSPLLSSTKLQQQPPTMTSKTTTSLLDATSKTQKCVPTSSAEKLVTSSSVPSKTVTCSSSTIISSTNPSTCGPGRSLPTTSGSPKTIYEDNGKSTISNSKQLGIVKDTSGRANPTTTTTNSVTVNSGRGVKQKDTEVCGPKEMTEGASRKYEQCQNKAGGEQRGGSLKASGGLSSDSSKPRATQQLPSAGKALPHTTSETAMSASKTSTIGTSSAATPKSSATTIQTVVMNKTAASITTPTAATPKSSATKTTAIINKTTTTKSLPPTAATTKSLPPTAATTKSLPQTAATTKSLPPTAATTKTLPPTAPTTKSLPPTAATTKSLPPTAATTKSLPPTAATTKSATATATKTTNATMVRRTDDSNVLKSDGSASVVSFATSNQTASNKPFTGEKSKQRDSNIIESTRI